MSVYYTAYTIIGCRIPDTRLTTVKRVPSCRHTYPERFTFCPHCGEPREKRKEPQWDEDTETFHGLQVVHDHDSDSVFLAAFVFENQYGKDAMPQPIPDRIEAQTRVQSILEPLDLWSPDTFGLWTWLESS